MYFDQENFTDWFMKVEPMYWTKNGPPWHVYLDWEFLFNINSWFE